MSTRRVVVATHGHCLDGLCSAALFTRLMRHVHGADELDIRYHAMGYGPGQSGVPAELLSGDDNAILDYRFATAPALTWYFDHHVSAFPGASDRAVFDERRAAAPTRFVHDGAYGSCTKLVADVSERSFALPTGPLAELVRWADIIDSAAFPSAEMAVAREEPALKLMTVVEAHGDSELIARLAPRLISEPFEAVAASREIAEAAAPLLDDHRAFVELVRRHAVVRGDAVFVDLTSEVVEVAGKFVTYALFPASLYSVALTRSKSKLKISVGYNPWAPRPRAHDIAKLCERFGGGGHPVVGAVSIALEEAERAHSIAELMVDELAKAP